MDRQLPIKLLVEIYMFLPIRYVAIRRISRIYLWSFLRYTFFCLTSPFVLFRNAEKKSLTFFVKCDAWVRTAFGRRLYWNRLGEIFCLRWKPIHTRWPWMPRYCQQKYKYRRTECCFGMALSIFHQKSSHNWFKRFMS